MANKAYFITATGTGLGKTWLTGALIEVCRRRGLPVAAYKPVLSGFDPAAVAASDAGVLAAKLGAGATAEALSPWRFAAPLSPDVAAAREGKRIDFDALLTWCRARIDEAPGLVLIEGIGGVMAPLTKEHTVREWIAALGIPAVLVGGSYLGALSHTLTAQWALASRGVPIAALVVNEAVGESVGLATTLSSLAHHVGATPLFALRRDDGAAVMRLLDFLLEAPDARS